MSHRRWLLVTEVGAEVEAALAAALGLEPRLELEHLVVAASPPSGRERSGLEAAGAWLERARAAARALVPGAEVGLLPALDAEALEAVVRASRIDLVIAGPRPRAAISTLGRLRARCPVALLWVPAPAAPPRGRPFQHVLCVGAGPRALRGLAAFLGEQGRPDLRVSLLALRRPASQELVAEAEAAGVRAPVTVVAPGDLAGGVAPWRALERIVRQEAVDLVVLPHPAPPLLRAQWTVPVLVPPPAAPPQRRTRRPLDVADPVALDGALRVRIGLAYGVARNPPLPDQEVAFVAAGRRVAIVTARDGSAELRPPPAADALGVFRVEGAAGEPVAAVERSVVVVRPGTRPLVLFDAELSAEELGALAAAPGVDVLAVRVRPAQSCHVLRRRLLRAGLAPRVADASAILDEGEAFDVNEALDGVRLARVATRMVAAGFPVVAIVHRGRTAPAARGFEAIRAGEVPGRTWLPVAGARRLEALPGRLDALTGAAAIPGNRIEVELDNARARRRLLEAIARAERTLHLQTYMAADDDVGREVEAALRGAAARGVTVRVLADSLHGLHGSFGLRNPLLDRLSAVPGVELRVRWPVAGLATLEDLKRRDHRKLAIADGRVALLGGRNLGHEYFRGFEEVTVTPATPWREVPWLDAGARVEGPAVAALQGAFRDAWTEAGGAKFELAEAPAAGATTARVVVHHGLEDAAALEAYLALIDTARSEVTVVTGFPLLLELQHALLRALRRGVRVRALFGNVAPRHGDEPFEGEWALARLAATALVHSRMDALVAAGAECFMLAVRDVPGWAPGMAPVHPHVHAKAVSADGRVCALGSANLDLTGSYWESELLLVVEDEAVARAFEAQVEARMAGSVRVRPEDPAWQRVARRREWLRHWPGVLSP